MLWSINKCLIELKTIDSRIAKAIMNFNPVGSHKKSSNKDYRTGKTIADFESDAKASYQSILDLMTRKRKIKEAVVNSNAITIITVAGQEMTVASAIERKKSIKHDSVLLNRMSSSLNNVLSEVSLNNEKMESNLQKQLEVLLGSDKSSNGATEFATSFEKQNGWELIDPLNINNEIKRLEEEIFAFTSEIDCALTTSNAITMVEIEE